MATQTLPLSIDRKIAELDEAVSRAFAAQDTTQQLEALNHAYKLLNTALTATAGYAADKPYLTLKHARAYIGQQADDLLAPIFQKEN